MISTAYPLIMGAAIATGVVASRFTQRSLPLARREKIGIAIGGFCGAMSGGKLPFVLSDWPGRVSGVAWFSDGKTILCGLVGGYFGVELAKWLLGVHITTGDSFAWTVAAPVGV